MSALCYVNPEAVAKIYRAALKLLNGNLYPPINTHKSRNQAVKMMKRQLGLELILIFFDRLTTFLNITKHIITVITDSLVETAAFDK